jgi:hypothetical protein
MMDWTQRAPILLGDGGGRTEERTRKDAQNDGANMLPMQGERGHHHFRLQREMRENKCKRC